MYSRPGIAAPAPAAGETRERVTGIGFVMRTLCIVFGVGKKIPLVTFFEGGKYLFIDVVGVTDPRNREKSQTRPLLGTA